MRIETDSQHYTDIAEAIRTKLISQDEYYPSDMGPAILSIPTTSLNLKDIFNHGNVVGLNPCYKFQQGGTSGITINDQTITLSKSNAYANFIFTQLIDKHDCSKICFDLEVPATYDGYKDVVIGFRNQSLGIPSQNYEQGMPSPYIQLISWYSQRNYSGTSPWYALARITVKLDISNINYDSGWIEIYRHYGDLIIYSMWLE